MAAPQLWPTEADRQAVLETVPLGRFGHAEEIAHAAVYRCSEYGRYINGECLTIDGGAWLNQGRFKRGKG